MNDEGDHLTAAELTSNVQLLLVAGHETMVNQIGLSMVTLFEHPDQMELLRARPDLWPQAVEELLRHSQLTSAIMPRIAAQDFMLGGTPIGADEAVIPVIGTANRDPAGSRTRTGSTSCVPRRRRTSGPVTARTNCLGAQLAKLELRIALGSLLSRFPTLAPAVDLADLNWKTGLSVRAVEELPVTW